MTINDELVSKYWIYVLQGPNIGGNAYGAALSEPYVSATVKGSFWGFIEPLPYVHK